MSEQTFPAKSEPRSGFRHFATITTRWADNDVYRHVNNSVYNGWIDTAVADYLVKEGVIDVTHSPVIGFVIENFCQFRGPVSYPEVVEGGVRVVHIGNTSTRYEVGIFKQGVEEAVAVGYLVHVFVDRNTQQPQPIPEDIRAALVKLSVQ